MNRWSTSLVRVVFGLSIWTAAALFSFVVGVISHSANGLLFGVAFLGAFFFLLLLARRSFPSVYSNLRRPRTWWRTRAIEVPVILAFAVIVSILSSRIATLWFGLLSISVFLVAVLFRVTDKDAELQVLLLNPDSGTDQVADRVHRRSASKLTGNRIRKGVRPIQSSRKPPFFIPDNYAIEVHNLAGACEWYKEKLGFQESRDAREDDSGRSFIDLQISDDMLVSLVQLSPGSAPDNRHVVFFANNLEKAHRWLSDRGVAVEPITADSGGNRLFRLRDLEGTAIEVCVEPK